MDVFSINKNSLVVENIDNSGEFAFKRPVVNSSDSTNLDELIISLNHTNFTISDDE